MIRVHKLTTAELIELEQVHRQTRDADMRSRCEMVLYSDEGLSPPEIARRVRRCYEAVGIAGLETKPRSGRPRRVTEAYERLLLETVAQTPRSMGLPFSNWTTAKLALYMAEQTGIVITGRQVENYLKTHGWRLRRPVRTVKQKQDGRGSG